jgi:hypothetical protein
VQRSNRIFEGTRQTNFPTYKSHAPRPRGNHSRLPRPLDPRLEKFTEVACRDQASDAATAPPHAAAAAAYARQLPVLVHVRC